ncbi:hypothetical protein AVEN_66698-1 [Araneus ventricosus]|uniref:Uncharacterized protein n=1 Tax=Araneus ventricosus TaxID=182803 RepID=A0A4Y2L1Q4_ARAVE|nr:hypothetical protein AVEN_66698-1 [Araneus ventricosus]
MPAFWSCSLVLRAMPVSIIRSLIPSNAFLLPTLSDRTELCNLIHFSHLEFSLYTLTLAEPKSKPFRRLSIFRNFKETLVLKDRVRSVAQAASLRWHIKISSSRSGEAYTSVYNQGLPSDSDIENKPSSFNCNP